MEHKSYKEIGRYEKEAYHVHLLQQMKSHFAKRRLFQLMMPGQVFLVRCSGSGGGS